MDGGSDKGLSSGSLAERPSSIQDRPPAPANDLASSAGAGPSRAARFEQAAVRAALRRWILEHAKVAPGELSDRTPLLESGLLSSLDVVELVLFVEELRGEEIDTDDIEPEVFTSIDALWEGFFAELE